jgi:hypothetical protein
MWVVTTATVLLFVWIAAKLWHIHSIPKKLAKEKNLSQAKFVIWLCLLGLIWKPLWVVAVLTIVIDWDKFQLWIKEARS